MKRAFSLVELLIVIAIILTLSSILMPVGAKAKDQAIQTNCISNMRQVYLAMKLYQEDFGDYPASHSATVRQFAEQTYVGSKLLCLASDMNREDSFIQYHATGRFVSESADQWRECQEIRGQEMPVVFDLWHGRKPYVIVGKQWEPVGWSGMVIREHGGLQRLDEVSLMRAYNPWLFSPPPDLPCSQEPSPLFNL